MMDTRTLVDKIQMRKIFWDTEIELIMKLKPTIVLDKDDILTLKEMTSGGGQNVGIQSMDALEAWKSWTAQYMALMKLRQKEIDRPLDEMLMEIHGITAPLDRDANEKPGTLQGDERPVGSDAE